MSMSCHVPPIISARPPAPPQRSARSVTTSPEIVTARIPQAGPKGTVREFSTADIISLAYLLRQVRDNIDHPNPMVRNHHVAMLNHPQIQPAMVIIQTQLQTATGHPLPELGHYMDTFIQAKKAGDHDEMANSLRAFLTIVNDIIDTRMISPTGDIVNLRPSESISAALLNASPIAHQLAPRNADPKSGIIHQLLYPRIAEPPPRRASIIHPMRSPSPPPGFPVSELRTHSLGAPKPLPTPTVDPIRDTPPLEIARVWRLPQSNIAVIPVVTQGLLLSILKHLGEKKTQGSCINTIDRRPKLNEAFYRPSRYHPPVVRYLYQLDDL